MSQGEEGNVQEDQRREKEGGGEEVCAPTYLKGNLKCLERKEERAVGAVQHAIGAPRGRYALVRRDASQSSWRKHGQHAKVEVYEVQSLQWPPVLNKYCSQSVIVNFFTTPHTFVRHFSMYP